MTEQTNFAETNAGSASTAGTSAPAGTSTPSTSNASNEAGEKAVPSSQPSDFAWIGREKAAAEKKGYERAMSEVKNSQNQTQQMGGITQVDPAELERFVDMRLQKRSYESQNLKLAEDFLQKLSSGESKYDDFKEVMGTFNLEAFVKTAPAVFHMVKDVENTAGVMRELASNPKKIADLQYTAHMNPAAAEREIRALSESIKVNDAAKQQTHAKEPLNQLKPSNVGVDNGDMSVSDLRKADWMRV